MDIQMLIPAPAQKITVTNNQKDFPSEEGIKNCTEIR